MRILLVACFITAFASVAGAQVRGYALAGPAGVGGFVNADPTVAAVAGAEYSIANRVALGGEGGLFGNLVTTGMNARILGPYHRGLVPFAALGVSSMGVRYGDRSFFTTNIGGGIDAWFKRRAGLRLEFVDHIRPDARGNTNYRSFRGGVVFR